jgi:hypothetical protein
MPADPAAFPASPVKKEVGIVGRITGQHDIRSGARNSNGHIQITARAAIFQVGRSTSVNRVIPL